MDGVFCAYCRELFAEGDVVQVLPPVMTVQRGQKSGHLGLYGGESQMPEQEYVHIECMSPFFNLDGSDYESLETRIRRELENELREEITMQVREEEAKNAGRICTECLEEFDEDELVDAPEVENDAEMQPFERPLYAVPRS